MMVKENGLRKSRRWMFPVVAFSLVIVLYLGSYLYVDLFVSSDPEQRALFGDKFGAVSALFSGLAFAGLIWAVWLQREELELQRRELIGQREQLVEQNKTLSKQNFEISFFGLLNLYDSIVSGLIVRRAEGLNIERRECFTHWWGQLNSQYNKKREQQRDMRDIDLYFEQYDNLKMDSKIGYYFRTIYNILKFVDQGPVKDKKHYSNLLRALMSSHELVLLFYNCAKPKWKGPFGRLVEEYELFEDMDRSLLLDPKHVGWFLSNAYGDSGY